jgi:hypothetical protein
MEVVPSKDIDVSNNKHFYLPHHAVFKIDSLTTKLRVVFDDSVKSSHNMSFPLTRCGHFSNHTHKFQLIHV